MKASLLKDLSSAAALSLFLILAYYLRANGFPAVILALIVLSLSLSLKHFLRLEYWQIVLQALIIYSLSVSFANRGPSVGNGLFLVSFVPFVASLFERSEKRLSVSFLYLAPVFVTWALAANWEFPSTFSPFVVFGIRESGFAAAAFLLSAVHSGSKNAKAFLITIGFILLALALPLIRTDFETAASYSRIAEWRLFMSSALLAALAWIIFVFETAGASEESKDGLAAALILTAPLITLYGFLTHFFRPLLPLPFNTPAMLYALALSAFCYLILRLKPDLAFTYCAFPFLTVFLLRLFFPAEGNHFYYHEQHYFYYSLGWEHFGPWFFAWLYFLVIGLRSVNLPILLAVLLSGAFSLPLYFSRLFHFSGIAPVEFFKDLGAEGVSWVRKPVFEFEPYLFFAALCIIIFIRYLFSVKGKRQ